MTATPRRGKPYIWITHLSKLLGGDLCLWKAWFAAHFRYVKHEEMAHDLAQWSREHTELMNARRQELEEAGYAISMESQNEFKMEGAVAIVAGKPDLVATMPGYTFVIDGKTGTRKDSDWWQVLLYLFFLPKARPDLIVGKLEGEVQYKRNDLRLTVRVDELTTDRRGQIVELIKTIGSSTPPEKKPSRTECKFCNIGPTDCPERVMEAQTVAVTDF